MLHESKSIFRFSLEYVVQTIDLTNKSEAWVSTMYASIDQSALFMRLSVRPDLQAKALELRSRVSTYLRAVDATFAHYTSHAIDHSDQIVRELSAMLYADTEDQKTISLKLNVTETYMLIIAIYLHDVGMVVTDREKFDVLGSQSWADYVAQNEVAGDMGQLKKDFAAEESLLDKQELFVLALEQRLQLAGYFRVRHADRARGAINGALRVVEDFLAGDSSAGRSLTAICTGHGLGRNELLSDANYPTRRDHFGEPVDVRLLTILLRLGDLLDMRSERACPLMYSIVSPLPASSEVHWSQYERVVSRVTSPTEIEIRAECQTAEEHRLLLDWCTWIADEIRDVTRLIAGGGRHSHWIPPKATVGGSRDTIQIGRAPGARYRAEDWKFQFDENEVVLRLVRDVHRGQFGFLRELLQNALDATRARAQLENDPSMAYPHLLPSEVRERYPISVRLETDDGKVLAITVEDNGLGMTADIVKNYFLQIGRSWYRSAEFARDFSFNPTSRFGIGFLSVFAVSNDVSVNTRWHKDDEDSALTMRLPGPKSHLLFEDSSRSAVGTSVEVKLQQPVDLSALIEFLKKTCVANEFDVVLVSDVPGEEDLLRLPDQYSDTEALERQLSGAAMQIASVRSNTDGVFGAIEFLIHSPIDGDEDWSLSGNLLEELVQKSNPLADPPRLGGGWIAINGLASDDPYTDLLEENMGAVRVRVDLRGADAAGRLGLDRERRSREFYFRERELEAALDAHIASVKPEQPYLVRLVERFGNLAPEWCANIRCIQTLDGSPISRKELLDEGKVFLQITDDSLIVPFREAEPGDGKEKLRDYVASNSINGPIILGVVHQSFSGSAYQRLLGRPDVVVHEVTSSQLLLGLSGRANRPASEMGAIFGMAADPGSELVRFPTGLISCLLNQSHPLIREILQISKQHKAAKKRLIGALVKSTYEDGLATHVRSVGAALENKVLIAYADHLSDLAGDEILWLPASPY